MSTPVSTPRKITLITGGSRGLGRNAALAVAARGGDLIVTWRNRRDEADVVVAEAERLGARAVALQLDVGDSASFPRFAQAVKDALRRHWQSTTPAWACMPRSPTPPRPSSRSW
jgi:NAD(P)-dependent dehydrogenase (short-subunit alcohol dehydrogenase family)